MFKKNTKEQIHMHPGIFKINLPFYKNNVVPGEDGILEPYYVPVDIIVGNDFDLERGVHATIIFHEDHTGLSIQNFFEKVATTVVKGYLEEFLNPIPFDSIEWVEVFNGLDGDGLGVHSVTGLEWNPKDHVFVNSPGGLKWNRVSDQEDAPWYVEYVLGDSSRFQHESYFFPER